MTRNPNPLHIFEVLAKQHEVMLLAYIRSIVFDHALAEDIAQQTFLIAFRKIHSLRDPAAFPSWLRGIARLEAFATLRRLDREIAVDPAALQQLDEVYQRLQRQYPTETWEERFQIVEQCFNQLPDSLQTVCRMHYFEDRRTRDIAESLALNLNAVLKRLERARSAIRTCVQQKLSAEAV